MSKFLSKPLSVRAAARVIVTATSVVVVASGVLIRFVDHHDFPNVWLGMWWALQTVTTVGYGDVVPTQLAGRIVGAFAMLQGIAFLAIVTAAITSTFVTRAANERGLGRSRDPASDRELMERRFDELERKLDSLAAASDN
jgi:voltage-gated potassium channel Kch